MKAKTMMNISDEMLQQFAQNASQETIAAKLNTMATTMGDTPFCEWVAREIVDRTRPQQAVPETYAQYRPVVRDGIEFFLSRVRRPRLVELIASQLKLPPDTAPEQRLLELAKRFPTLHKLGQTIARNPGLDPQVKKWLIHLEHGRYGTPMDGLMARIDDLVERSGERGQLAVAPDILAEASVGAVIPFEKASAGSKAALRGVFKILRPGVRSQVEEELAILEATARFFEDHRSRYPLKNLQFLDLFHEVRQRLVREIDVAAEQDHLAEAAGFYSGQSDVKIPQRLPFSTDTVTAMTFLEGPKITDADLTSAQRRRIATLLFDALICKPLFSRRPASLFHGDPHAGNILALRNAATGRLGIGLVDWSLAGHLSKPERIRAAQLIQAVFKSDLSGIRRTVTALNQGPTMDTHGRRQFRQRLLDLMRSTDFASRPLVGRSFKLLEHLALEGFVFPADLMLFGKAIFTLEGVLNDLWPRFDMDAAITRHLTNLMTREVPHRFRGLFFPLTDRPENYPSLVSNAELHTLMMHHYFSVLRASSNIFDRYCSAWGRLFTMPLAAVPAPISTKDVVKR
jgi:ubiquinone biosynthesis protein